MEKFVKRAIKLLKVNDEFFFIEKFKTKINENYQQFVKTKEIRLNNEYLYKMREYINLILKQIEIHNKTNVFDKEYLLKEANLLHKERNKHSYKKDKHIQKKFSDGY